MALVAAGPPALVDEFDNFQAEQRSSAGFSPRLLRTFLPSNAVLIVSLAGEFYCAFQPLN